MGITAVINQKGGVGKTTVTLGLAAAVAANGGEVVVVDGADKLRDGARIKPSFGDRPAAAAAAAAKEGPGNAVAKTAGPNPEGVRRSRGGQ